MLPDFVELKRLIAERMASSIREDLEAAPLLSRVGHHHIHEGDRFTIARRDGSEESKRFQRVEASTEISTEDIRAGGSQVIQRARARLVEQLRGSSTRMLLDTARRASEEVGNVLHAGGQPLSAELMLEILEKMDFSFSPEGQWEPPTIVFHPSMEERARMEFERLERDPELKARMDALIVRKREESCAREADRKLVD